ncbi:hypothetical protein [Paraburkholderia dipogonis]|uniref:hypothetical protein n=1 Tax=Paraburkholderia dipogonis TaxID=1211383 RepID=UPI0038B759C0
MTLETAAFGLSVSSIGRSCMSARDDDHAELQLEQFRFEACVDWVELRVRTQRDAKGQATNGGTLKRLLADLRVSYAFPVDPADGGAATEFLIRIQAPRTLRDVRSVVDRIAEHRQLVGVPSVAAIEIAFDSYPKTAAAYALLDRMTLRFMYHLLPPSRELRNACKWAGRLFSHESVLMPTGRPIVPSHTLYIRSGPVADHRDPDYVRGTLTDRYERRCRDGGTTPVKYRRSPSEIALDDVQWRVYRKVTDEQFADEGSRLPATVLPADQHRARAEVTLSGQFLRELKLETLDDLAAFDFADIARRKLLRFATVTTAPYFADEFRQRVFVKALGLDEHSPACIIGPIWNRDSQGRKRDMGPFLIADTDLNARLKKQLQRRTAAFRNG